MSWEPKVGDVIYTSGGSHNEEVWDDSELIEHWETAMEEYRASQGITNELPPFSVSRNNQKAATARTEAGKERHPQPKKFKKESKKAKDNVTVSTDATTTASTVNSIHSAPTVSHPPPPPPLPMQHEDTDFSNLLMAWYYSGYYTGYYQGSRN